MFYLQLRQRAAELLILGPQAPDFANQIANHPNQVRRRLTCQIGCLEMKGDGSSSPYTDTALFEDGCVGQRMSLLLRAECDLLRLASSCTQAADWPERRARAVNTDRRAAEPAGTYRPFTPLIFWCS
jgi:hypothetical protein